MIGTKLAHYEITSHLGTGGMGEVYQATDSKLGRSVAIKLVPEAFTHDQDRAARFEREARVLASLNHPNIAAIYGVEESGGRKHESRAGAGVDCRSAQRHLFVRLRSIRDALRPPGISRRNGVGHSGLDSE